MEGADPRFEEAAGASDSAAVPLSGGNLFGG